MSIVKTAARLALLALFIYPAGFASAADDLNLVEGFWETFVIIHLGGGMLPLPAIKSGKCISRQDPLPNSIENSRMHCRVFDKSISGNDVSWRLECGDKKGKMDGQATITYAGKKFTGKMEVLVTEIGGNRHAKMEYVMKGDRVRDCEANDPR